LFLVFWYFPFSNAAVERVFSQMNIVKNNLRNKMGLKSLNAILSIRLDFKMFNNLLYTKDILLNFIDMDYDGKCCHDYEIPNKYLALAKSSAKYTESNDEIDEIISLLIKF